MNRDEGAAASLTFWRLAAAGLVMRIFYEATVPKICAAFEKAAGVDARGPSCQTWSAA